VNDARSLLNERSRSYLLNLGLQVERDLTRPNATEAERDQALALARALFAQVNALLKSALDVEDLETFTEAEREWAEMFQDFDLPEGEIEAETLQRAFGRGVPPDRVRQLLRYRGILLLGLAMWATHLLAAETSRASEMPLYALRILSQRFGDVEHLLSAFEQAIEGEREESLPWTNWFLSEKSSGEAHMIPTRSEMLFTTVLLTVMIAQPDPPALAPRVWVKWSAEEITAALERLDAEAARWSIVVPAPALDTGLQAPDPQSLQWWHDRVQRARDLFAHLASDTEVAERIAVRDAPLDPDRVQSFRSHLLSATRESRLVHDIFSVQGGLESLSEQPDDHISLASRSWMPKSYFTPDSRVVGLEMSAGSLARVTANSEINQLLAVLPQTEPRRGEGALEDNVSQAIEELRERGLRPSLIVIPIGLELRRSLGIEGWGGLPEAHPLIPLTRRRDFEGVLEDVPIIDFPHAPTDRLWVADLAAAARYRQWPSDEDSGIHFDLQSFDAKQATTMLTEHPEVRGEGLSDAQAIDDLQERLLLSLTLCWEIQAEDLNAAIAIAIPPELQRN
jgi:hypothetical protein